MSNDTLFLTQIGSIVVYIFALFVLYRLLVEKKDATIQFLEKQLEAAKGDSSDIVLKKLSERVQIAKDELERISKDKDTLAGLNAKAVEYIEALQGVIKADKELIQSLEEYRNEAQSNRPLVKFFNEVVEHLGAQGKNIVLHKAKDGAVDKVEIIDFIKHS